MFIKKYLNNKKCFLVTEMKTTKKIELVRQQLIKTHYVWTAENKFI